MSKFKVYFSHSRKMLDTQELRECDQFLAKIFGEAFLFDPIKELGDDDKGTGIYENYLRNNCRLLICREYKGHIGRGQYTEIKVAEQHHIPILVLRGSEQDQNWKLIQFHHTSITNQNDWFEKFAQIITN